MGSGQWRGASASAPPRGRGAGPGQGLRLTSMWALAVAATVTGATPLLALPNCTVHTPRPRTTARHRICEQAHCSAGESEPAHSCTVHTYHGSVHAPQAGPGHRGLHPAACPPAAAAFAGPRPALPGCWPRCSPALRQAGQGTGNGVPPRRRTRLSCLLSTQQVSVDAAAAGWAQLYGRQRHQVVVVAQLGLHAPGPSSTAASSSGATSSWQLVVSTYLRANVLDRVHSTASWSGPPLIETLRVRVPAPPC